MSAGEAKTRRTVNVGGSPSWSWATGNIVSTTADVARFYRGLLQGRLLAPHLLTAMLTTVETGQIFRYGLGMAALPLPCGGTVWVMRAASPATTTGR